MANSFIEYTGDGSTTAYTITFDYLATADVKAFLNGTATTAFSVNGQTLTFNSAPASQTSILIERDTPKASRLVDFSDGAILSEADLDKNANQLFFISQEAVDTADRAMALNSANQFDATVSSTARRIVNMADPVDAQDAVTKNWLTTTYLTPTDITNIGTTGTNIANINTVAGAIANVNSVAGNATNINTVAGNNANINTVAGNNANISTVAGIAANVTTVANASTNIAAVAADIAKVQTVANDLNETVSEIETVANDLNEQTSEIDTVAGAVTNINTVGTNINNVNATGGAITNVNTVAGQISPTNNIGTVAGISTEIGNVSGISSAVSSVGGAITNVNAVAGQISPTNNISTVASNISDIQDVGSNIGALTTVNGISSNVSTVAGISANVTTVAGNSTNVTNVANNNSNITAVAGAVTNINTVAANVTNVGAVANISSDVTTVAGNNANISTVAGISANVSTVASNVAGVNSFADRYRVGSSDPSSSNDAGDLFFNTSASALKFYNGSQWNVIQTISSLTDLNITDGTNGQALKTDGNGNFSFGDVATSTAFADITGKPTTLSGYGITNGIANNAVGEIAADGVPLTLNSTNSNTAKLGLEDNGTVRGYVGATSTICFQAINDGAASRFQVSQNGAEVKQISTGSSAYYRFNQNATDRNYLYQSSANEIGFLTTTGGWAFKCDNSGNVTATGNVTAYSDERLKDDIEPIEGALERVGKLQGVEYTRKSTGEREIGFIAQDVIQQEPTLVDVVDTSTDHTDEAFSDLHVMKYQNTTALLVEAIKELQAEVAELKERCSCDSSN